MAIQGALGSQVIIDSKFIHCIKCGKTVGVARKNIVTNKVTLDFSKSKDMTCPGCGTKVRT